MATAKDRLCEYLQTKGISQSRFEKMAGISNSYITNLKHAPKEGVLEKILAAASDLSKVWLLTGEGSMLNDSSSNTVSGNTQGNNSTINNGPCSGMSMCGASDREIEAAYTELIQLRAEVAALRAENERITNDKNRLYTMLETLMGK